MKSRFFASVQTLFLGGALLASTQCAFAEPSKGTQESRVTEAKTVSTPVIVTTQDESTLALYQLALDQLATGSTETARTILEDSVHRYGPRPEINLLLAYVLQRNGNNGAALNAASQVVGGSSLAAALSVQLRGSAPASTAVSPIISTTGINAQPLGTLSNAIANLEARIGNADDSGVVPVSNNSAINSGAILPQNDARLAKLETAMMDMVNAERAKVGLDALLWNSDLASIARAHSGEMRDKNYFSHDSPTPGLTTHLDRYRAAGRDTPRVIAENIFRAWGAPKQVGIADVQSGNEALMKSPGHRANILYQGVTQIGIGIAVNTKGDIWITQMFLRP